ncbi:MAG: DUF3187 family protein [Desulfosarcinaceae bacterium]
MGIAKWFAVPLILLLLPAAVRGESGPLQLKNRFPLHLLFLTPRLSPSRTPGQGDAFASLAVDYSAVYFRHANEDWDYLIDMEMTTVDLAVTYGLTRRLALTADLPFVSMNAGVLDRFLEGYHNALGVPNYGREERPDNAFAYRVNRQGRTWISADSGTFQLADATISAQWQFLRKPGSNSWDGSAIMSLKAPTGNVDEATGSGRWDYGLFVNGEHRRSRWSYFAMAGIAINHDPDTGGARIRTRPSYSLAGAVGYDYSDRTTWLVQVSSYTSPIEETGISEVDTPAAELGLGFRYQVAGDWNMEFAFGEDLTRAAPDFTVHLGVMRRIKIRQR